MDWRGRSGTKRADCRQLLGTLHLAGLTQSVSTNKGLRFWFGNFEFGCKKNEAFDLLAELLKAVLKLSEPNIRGKVDSSVAGFVDWLTVLDVFSEIKQLFAQLAMH